jgi:hypothetical protein
MQYGDNHSVMSHSSPFKVESTENFPTEILRFSYNVCKSPTCFLPTVHKSSYYILYVWVVINIMGIENRSFSNCTSNMSILRSTAKFITEKSIYQEYIEVAQNYRGFFP